MMLVDVISAWPEWVQYLVQGLGLGFTLVFSAIIASRAGRSPYWALVMIIPYFYIPSIAVWALALCRWPLLRDEAAKG